MTDTVETMEQVWNEGLGRAAATYATRRLTIDPITRLEGHGKIDIFLDAAGDVERAYFQVPELRGFEQFCVGRPAEDMPQITSRVCGVCPTAHHMAATKALDALYQVEPPPAAKKLRELVYNAFMLEDHALHVYVLGGPDFLVGPEAPKEMRNLIGVIQKFGVATGQRVISMRRRIREIVGTLGGKPVHPVLGLPGGVAKPLAAADRARFAEVAKEGLEFARFTLQVFKDVVLANPEYVGLITADAYTHRTYYMGLVDEKNRTAFYDGQVRVVDPEGKEFARFPIASYLDHIAEHVESWSYVKFCYLKRVGWHGFVDGKESGVYSVAPLARLNASEGFATPEAEAARAELFATLGGRPVHHTLANHWARVVEMIAAAERLGELLADPEITSTDVRTLPRAIPKVGIGVVEAPRGTLIHHYETDERGLIRKANLIVATQGNSARMAMSVERAAKSLIRGGAVSEGLLNKVEMAFRAYDPCHGCAAHTLPGQMGLIARLIAPDGTVVRTIER